MIDVWGIIYDDGKNNSKYFEIYWWLKNLCYIELKNINYWYNNYIFFLFEVIKFNSDMYGFLMIIVWVCLINLFLYIFFKRW